MTRFTTEGKEVLCEGTHFADGRDIAAANEIAGALNAGWRPIADAPRDEDVLIFSFDAAGHGVMIGYWSDWENGGPDWSDAWSQDQIDADPTHWMPLPDAPVSA